MTGKLINQILEEIGLESLDKSAADKPGEKQPKEKHFEYNVGHSPQVPSWRHEQRFSSRYHQNIW